MKRPERVRAEGGGVEPHPRQMHYYYRKALHAARFSAAAGARSLAVPSKLLGTSLHQPALCVLAARMAAEDSGPLPLTLWQEDGVLRVAAVLGGRRYVLGRVQHRHVSWLLPHGAQAFALGVTGLSRPGATLGLNVAFGHVGAAVARCCFPCGPEPGGDGAALRVAEEAEALRRDLVEEIIARLPRERPSLLPAAQLHRWAMLRLQDGQRAA